MGGYMPIPEVARSWIADKGFNGWVSLEIFDRRMREPAFQPETDLIHNIITSSTSNLVRTTSVQDSYPHVSRKDQCDLP